MSFNYLSNEKLNIARDTYISKLIENGFKAKTEIVKVSESCGRISAKAIYAKINAPHYPASAMDGIAIKASDSFGATETTPVILRKDQFIVVDTGDPVPESCDAVVMIEDVIYQEDGSAKLFQPAAPWQHIRQIGEDICANEMILASNMKITPAAIGSMLAGGVLEAEVIKNPVIGLIPSGDEIVLPTGNPKPGDIIEFNSSIFSSMLGEIGAKCIVYPIVKDKFDLIKEAIGLALSECDIVILNAGSSAGRDDYSCDAIASFGEVLYHGIAIKPGKPAILACQNEKPILGVPGYPVSGIIVINEILGPIIDLWYSKKAKKETAKATLSKAVVSGLKYEEFVRVRLGYVNDKLIASPLNRGAGVVSSFMKADGIMRVAQNLEGIDAGDSVDVELLKPLNDLKNTIVAIGSHDPLLDELCDMLHLRYPNLYMSSSHVGSMGGIMAVKRGENHIAGIHLLDESDGKYNESYLKKYFPRGGVKLVECVGRTQGIMVAKGNPLGISSIKDLAKDGVRYVNRQKGSGTRILIDYLLKKEGIPCSDIYGYDREEFTHSSVATQIAAGSGDAGMGIYSAANIYGLDFIPICTEQYDLLIPDYAWDSQPVQKLIEILKSDEFKERLERLGGYTLGHPGEIREY